MNENRQNGAVELKEHSLSCSNNQTNEPVFGLGSSCSLLCSSSGSMQVFLPPEGLTKFGEASPTQDNVFCAQLQRFQIKSMNERGLHSWHAENCYKKFPFLCKRSMSALIKTQ